jgi:hypothetical protein
MRTVRDPDVLIATWLEEGPTELPDSTTRAIATAIEALPQRRLNRLPWRFSKMNRQFRLAIGAAAVVVAAVGGIYLLRPPADSFGGPAISPSPGVSPTSTPTEPLIGTATLTPTECAFARGPAPLKPGLLRIDLGNESGDYAGFDVFRVKEAATYADLADYMREEDARVKAGEPYSGFPPMAEHYANWGLSAGETFSMIVDARTGTYGLVCVRIDSATIGAGNEVSLGYFLIGPLEVR